MRTATPFSRVKAAFAAISAAMELALPDRAGAFAAMTPYKSRGHGLGLLGNKHSRHRVAMDKRAATKQRNRARQR